MKKYGIEGEIANLPHQGIRDEIEISDDIKILINGGNLKVEFSKPGLREAAKEAADLLLASWNLRNRWDLKVEFNRDWEIDDSGARKVSMSLCGEVKASSRERASITYTENINGTARIVTQEILDTASFTNDQQMVVKAAK